MAYCRSAPASGATPPDAGVKVLRGLLPTVLRSVVSAEDYWRWTMSGVRCSRSRHKKETEPAVPLEPTISTLWASPNGPGVLMRPTCV
ncbi:hypothetical protein GCM10010330_67820 [Streptomyces tendae]|nr:hypothetical protein GCM10010330_67820 [Streptomyces tendae]